LKTSIAAFLILLPLLFGLTFDNKHILTKELGKDVLQRRLTGNQPHSLSKLRLCVGMCGLLNVCGETDTPCLGLRLKRIFGGSGLSHLLYCFPKRMSVNSLNKVVSLSKISALKYLHILYVNLTSASVIKVLSLNSTKTG